jgi:hypothetical protein
MISMDCLHVRVFWTLGQLYTVYIQISLAYLYFTFHNYHKSVFLHPGILLRKLIIPQIISWSVTINIFEITRIQLLHVSRKAKRSRHKNKNKL